MLMQDKFTGKSRGFAFVTMATEQEAQNAITQFNGKTVEGRALTVNEARPREARPPGGGGGGGGGYGRGGGGYGRGGGGGGGGGYGRGDRGSR
jgi:cold-inducible RNA-binding protein